MSEAFEDALADAMVAELNLGSQAWSATMTAESCTAVRTRAPWYEITQLATLQIAVVPLTIDRTRVARGERTFLYGFGVDLQREIAPTDDANLKAFSYFAEQLHNWFDNGHALTGFPTWFCLQADRNDVYSLAQLYTEEIWETLIMVKVFGSKVP